MHVRYKCFYISLPPSEKQQLEITKFCVSSLWNANYEAYFSYFQLELNALIAYSAYSHVSRGIGVYIFVML